jgi:chemotaxis protein MotB
VSDHSSSGHGSKGIPQVTAHHEEGEEGEGPWLMSFADLVTILMCFFILFFSAEKSTGVKNGSEEKKGKEEKVAKVVSSAAAADSQVVEAATQVQKDLSQLASESKINFSVATPETNVLEVTFRNSRFFDPGSPDPTAAGSLAIEAVAKRFKQLGSSVNIVVEGHTDSDPIRTKRFPSNWELSAARASSVVRIMLANRIDPRIIHAVGFAQFRPVAREYNSNGYPIHANKALNRRVVLRATGSPQKAPPEAIESKKGSGDSEIPDNEKNEPEASAVEAE